MAKPNAKPAQAPAAKEEEAEGQGHKVTLPNGEKRIEYIRDAYYDSKTGLHGEKQPSRGDIKKAINEMLEAAGRKDEQIPYQIVFAATKTPEDPRVAAAAAKKVAEAAKAAKKAEEAKAAAAAPAPAAKGKK
jgi:hypothetical protein